MRIAPNEYSVDDAAAIKAIYGHGTNFTKVSSCNLFMLVDHSWASS